LLREADYNIECHTGLHLPFTVLGAFCMLLYPIGVPLWFGVFLFRNRKQIRAAPDFIEIAHYRPLFQFYKPDCWLFEVYFMLEKVVLVGLMGFLDRRGLMQAAVNMTVVLLFLLLIVRRMPSKTEEYNKGNIFSHINILAVYLASLMLNPAVTLDATTSVTEERILIVLLLLQALLLTYLVFISFGKLREIVRNAKAQVKLEKRGAEIAAAQLAGEKVPGPGVDYEPGHRFQAVASSAVARSLQALSVDAVNPAITPDGFVDHFVAGGESKLAAGSREPEPPPAPSAARQIAEQPKRLPTTSTPERGRASVRTSTPPRRALPPRHAPPPLGGTPDLDDVGLAGIVQRTESFRAPPPLRP
jgi:hypothetical protein